MTLPRRWPNKKPRNVKRNDSASWRRRATWRRLERARAEEQAQANRRLRRRAAFLVIAFDSCRGAGNHCVLSLANAPSKLNDFPFRANWLPRRATTCQWIPSAACCWPCKRLSTTNTLEAEKLASSGFAGIAHPANHSRSRRRRPESLLVRMGSDWRVSAQTASAIIWDVASGEQLLKVSVDPGDFGLSVAFSPDGKLLATAWTTKVVVWDVATGREFGDAGR